MATVFQFFFLIIVTVWQNYLAVVLTGKYCACTGEEALHEYLRTKAITVEYWSKSFTWEVDFQQSLNLDYTKHSIPHLGICCLQWYNRKNPKILIPWLNFYKLGLNFHLTDNGFWKSPWSYLNDVAATAGSTISPRLWFSFFF